MEEVGAPAFGRCGRNAMMATPLPAVVFPPFYKNLVKKHLANEFSSVGERESETLSLSP
jgi:hypothetical protein